MQSKLILIVDDNMDTRYVFAAILNYDGYRVMEAANGQHGLAYARDYRPDLILMAVNMPDMDGYTAAQLLRRSDTTRNIPIIAITGNTVLTPEKAPSATPFNSCFTKPLTPHVVLDEVTRLIGPPS